MTHDCNTLRALGSAMQAVAGGGLCGGMDHNSVVPVLACQLCSAFSHLVRGLGSLH